MPPITKNQRVLVVANFLAKPKDREQQFRWLYEFIETSAPRVVRRRLQNHYREIHELVGEDCRKERFVSLLEDLTKDASVRAVDVFLQLHGAEPSGEPPVSWMQFFIDDWRAPEDLATEIRQRTKPGRLRLLYTTNCYGDSHTSGLLNAGFLVGVGSIGVNANAGTEFPAFCRIWSTGVSVEEVVRRADRDGRRLVQDAVAKGMGFSEANSKKIVRGDRAVTIRTAPRIGPSRISLVDEEVRIHERRRGSRQLRTFNDRRMQQDCVVRAVSLLRVDEEGVVVDGPSRDVTIDRLRRAGAIIDGDGVGTSSLRVQVVSWNGLLTQDLRFKVVYSVDRKAGVTCAL